jgi:peptide/nickel transport system ATP-binding protein
MALLSVENLTVDLVTTRGQARAVRAVDFTLSRGQTLGLVGESGCGKSITALALMGLLPEGAVTGGRVLLEDRDLLTLPDREMQKIRGGRLAMIFQEPMTSLNPVHRVGRQIGEALALHRNLRGAEARAEVVRLLERVGLPQPARRADSYPHELSGGQRQRVMIAMALSCQPDVLIADEPTTALDVTIQGQILDLINDLVDDGEMALIMISHDLGVIAETCERIMIMYGGMVVERGATAMLGGDLVHPYSQGLIAAVPQPGRARAQRLSTIPGMVPELHDLPAGCPFADRCELADDRCHVVPPGLYRRAADQHHLAACHKLAAAWQAAP